MRYAEYQNARDIAWRVLIEQKIMHLPVNVSSLCLRYESYPLTYDRAEQILKRYGLARNCKGNDGFALRMKERIFIFYNNRCPAGRIRFTLAHELGHVLLGHVQERFPAARDEAAEQQANIFASRLLAPACVLRALEVETPEALMTLCGLSRKAAEVRLERMRILRAREACGVRYRQHELERQVLRQFTPFIDWAREREPHQSFAQFQIVREGCVVGTTLGMVSSVYTDIVALPPDVELAPGDRLRPMI